MKTLKAILLTVFAIVSTAMADPSTTKIAYLCTGAPRFIPQGMSPTVIKTATKEDIDNYDVFFLTPGATVPFEPGAFEKLLNTPNKTMILDICSIKIAPLRKLGAWDFQKLSNGSTALPAATIEESFGVPNKCNIMRLWNPKSAKDKETEFANLIAARLSKLK